MDILHRKNISLYVTTETYVELHLHGLMLLLLPTFTIIGNLLVIIAVIRFKSLHSSINFLILELAIADLFVGLFVMPYAVYIYMYGGYWLLGNLMCDIYSAADVACSTASILLLALISFDRYRAVSHPIHYSLNAQNVRRVLPISVVIWLISLSVAAPMAFGVNYRPPESNPNECRFYNPEFSILSSIISFVIPCSVVILLHLKIFIRLHQREKAAIWRRKTPIIPQCSNEDGNEWNDMKQNFKKTLGISHRKLTDTQSKYSVSTIRKYTNTSLQTISENLLYKIGTDSLMHTSSSSQRAYFGSAVTHRVSFILRQTCGFLVGSTSKSSQNPMESIKTVHCEASILNEDSDLDERIDRNAEVFPNDLNKNLTIDHKIEPQLPSQNFDCIMQEVSEQQPCPCSYSLMNRMTASNTSSPTNVIYIPQSPVFRFHAKEVDELKRSVCKFDDVRKPVHLKTVVKEECPNQPTNIVVYNNSDSGFRLQHKNIRNAVLLRKSMEGADDSQHSGKEFVTMSEKTLKCGRNKRMLSYCTCKIRGIQQSYTGPPKLSGTVNEQLSLVHSIKRVKCSDLHNHEAKQNVSRLFMWRPQSTLSNEKRSRLRRKEKRATKALGIVVGVFLICWMPFFSMNVLNAICIKWEWKSCQIGFTPFFYSTWIGYINSCLNPIIYTIFNGEFRRAFRKILFRNRNIQSRRQ